MTDKRIILAKIIFIACLVSFLPAKVFSQNSTWTAPAYTDTLKNPLHANEATLSSAKDIYNHLCWPCHGLEGKGNGPASAALNPKPADHTSTKVQRESDGNIFWKISTGKGNMQPYIKVLTAKERWELVIYIRHLAGKRLTVNE